MAQSMLEPGARPEPSPKRRAKFLAGGGVIALALVVLVAWAMTRADATSFYLTTSELVAHGPTQAGSDVRVNGRVVPGSIHHDGLHTTFTITDGKADVAVATAQGLPSSFKEGSDVVAHGTYDGTTFTAAGDDAVLTKCPSRFKPAAG